MSGREDSYSRVTDADLGPFVKEANSLLARIRWQPELSEDERLAEAQKGWPREVLAQAGGEIALPEEFKILDGDALILSQDTNTVLQVLRDGIAIGLYAQDDVAKRIGLEALEQSDRLRAQGMSTEVRHRKFLLSAVQAYVVAYYTLWNLRDFHEDTRLSMQRTFPGLPELVHDHSVGAQSSVFRSILYYYAELIKPQNGLVNSREELIDATVQYFKAVMRHVKEYIVPGLQEGDLFAEVRYSFDGSGFTISGFDEEYGGLETEVPEIKNVLFTDIIGNHVAKARLKRAVDLMFLRDMTTGENPAMRFGSIPNVFFAQGKPGAGKTLLASALGTLALKRAEQTGLKVRVLIYPRNIVSKYQGVSSERAISFWKSTKQPGVITIVIMDEAEQLIPDRDDDRASSGAKAGTNAFLVATEGADQIDDGSRLVFLATNHAHQCDPAALSRAKEKVEVNGAETVNDYMDFIRLMLGMQDEVFQEVLHLEHPATYTFMYDQEHPPSPNAPKDASPILRGVDAIVGHAREQFGADEYDFFGTLFYQFQRANPGFSLRDLRNIIEATIFGLSQYDIPDSFFDPEQPDYHPLALAEKEQKLRGLLEGYLRESGVRFADIFLENALRQLREIEKVEQIEHDRAVARRVNDFRVYADAVAQASKLGIALS